VLRPKDLSLAITRLRGGSLLTFDRLTDAQLELEALPGWTVADVFRHLADSDRRSVVAGHLAEFLPGRDLDEFEQHNDTNLARLRDRDRATLRRELEVWGRRLARVVALVPSPLARVRVPTAFGRLPLGWLAGLRLYDEWVHRWDVAGAIGESEPPMDAPLRALLAEFQLRALPAGPLDAVRTEGVVEVAVVDGPVWRFDLGRRRFGAHVRAEPTARVAIDVPALCLVAGDRVPWRRLAEDGRILVDDDTAGSGAALLDVCRVV
jgi:uncharacterized protein (TIGR03083 family)